MQSFEIVGYDAGYDYIKLVVGYDEGGKIKFPSVTYKPTGSSLFTNDLSNSNFSEDNLVVEFEGKEYYIGNLAITQDPRGGEKNFSDEKFRNPSEIVKLLAGISLYAQENNLEIKNLVLGLNIENYSKFKDEIISIFKNKSFKYKISKGEEQFTLNIGNVICVPQGVGSYYQQVLDHQGQIKNGDLLEARYGLIDLGGRTVDSFISQGVDPIRGSELGTNYGMSDAFREVAKELGEDIPYNLIEQSYLKGKNKVFWKGRNHNIDALCRQSFANLAERIYNQLINQWDKQLDRVEFIMLCGGGAQYLGEHLNDLFNIKVKIIDNPQFSNANGYYKLGIYSKED